MECEKIGLNNIFKWFSYPGNISGPIFERDAASCSRVLQPVQYEELLQFASSISPQIVGSRKFVLKHPTV